MHAFTLECTVHKAGTCALQYDDGCMGPAMDCIWNKACMLSVHTLLGRLRMLCKDQVMLVLGQARIMRVCTASDCSIRPMASAETAASEAVP